MPAQPAPQQPSPDSTVGATPQPQEFVYIGKCSRCGVPVGGAVDRQDRNTAKWVADFVRGGLIVERVPAPATIKPGGCSCPPTASKSKRQGSLL